MIEFFVVIIIFTCMPVTFITLNLRCQQGFRLPRPHQVETEVVAYSNPVPPSPPPPGPEIPLRIAYE